MPEIAGQPVIIQELEGNFRSLTLLLSNLPDRGVEAPAELRMVVNRYPGNDSPSVQIMGDEEQEITFKGQFNDVLTGIDGGALEKLTSLRDIFKGKRYLQVSWGTNLVRRGFLKRVKGIYERASLIGYEFTLLPIEADEPSVLAVPFPNQVNPLSLLESIRAILATLDEMADRAIAFNNLARAIF